VTDNDTQQLLGKIIEQQNQLLQELHAQRKSGKKDLWDRLTTVAPIFAALIIASTGAYFTYSYNQQQIKVQEIQTIEKFIPHLIGDEKSKRAAVLAISSLGNAPLAAKVARIFASPGTASALESIAQNGGDDDRKAVKSALSKTLDSVAQNYQYEHRFDDAVETYKKALAIKEQIFGKDSPELVENIDKLAELYELHGDHANAEEMYRRAASLKHQDLATKHTDAVPAAQADQPVVESAKSVASETRKTANETAASTHGDNRKTGTTETAPAHGDTQAEGFTDQVRTPLERASTEAVQLR
jgi:tetratricopeptide (TPR) repeat protein